MKKKILLFIILLLVLCCLLIVLYFSFKERKIIVFAYHKVVPAEIKEKYYKDDPWIDTTERFEEQMKFLNDRGYTTISMNEYEAWRIGKKKFPLRTVMITIDDGDVETYYEMMPILKKYNFKATYFMIGEKVEDKTEKYDPSKKQFLGRDLIDKIESEYPNLELQSHSFGMHNRNGNDLYVLSMEEEEIKEDFDKMEFLDTDVYCYPYGVHNDKILNVLNDKGYRMAFKLDKSGVSRRSDDKFLIQRVGVNYDTSFTNFKKWLIKSIVM